MVEDKRIAVVIPAYNEEALIETTLAGIPPFVDHVYVVDDASRDGTVGRAHTAAGRDARITVLAHEKNRGAGGAVVTGYQARTGRRLRRRLRRSTATTRWTRTK